MLTILCKIHCFFLAMLLFSACGLGSHSESSTLFHEKYRPQIHFSPMENWMSAPTGLVYFENEYHLFYPYDTKGGWGKTTHWGHAVSSDMINWKHLPIALFPDSLGAIHTGSVVVDADNRSGFGTSSNPPLVAVFTYHNYDAEAKGEIMVETLGLAFSLDKGKSWVKYAYNPVLTNPGVREFKDPKIVWHQVTKQWVMTLVNKGRIQFYTSTNLREWSFASDFGKELGDMEEMWESPDLFELSTGNDKEKKWVLIVNINFGSTNDWATGYFTGDFDGVNFVPDQTIPLILDYGKDNYGGSTFNNTPDGRRVMMAWMNNWQYAADVPTQIWKCAATFPKELRLEENNGKYLLAAQPIDEIRKCYGQQIHMKNIDITQNIHEEGILDLTSAIPFSLLPLEITIQFETDKREQIGFAEKFGIRLRNEEGEFISVGYDNFNHLFYIDRTHSVDEAFSEDFAGIHSLKYSISGLTTIDMRLIFDTSSLELFALGGKAVLTDTFYPTSVFSRMELFSENGTVSVNRLSIKQLKSIWN